ncbi:MAG: tRNA (guanosine(37)-N1)-methyltransferase TrmD [Chlorobi bacterium]|nr:tRNA (guanosine(37)-N1)-methyltransferase TrmD [Chlorobiota bacterium]
MRIDILSAVPELLESFVSHSIVGRAVKEGQVDIRLHDLHDYGLGRYRQIDDYPYGGGAGMVLRPEPVARWIEQLQSERDYDEIIFMTPDAPVLRQSTVNELVLKKNLIIIAGHYKGLDQRIRDRYVTREISIGDYVLSGGELPAAVLTDAIVRLLPGVLNDETSALTDSFQNGLLSAPVYTRPLEFKGMKVPDVLRSGNHAAIEKWREEKSYEKTRRIRPDLLDEE